MTFAVATLVASGCGKAPIGESAAASPAASTPANGAAKTSRKRSLKELFAAPIETLPEDPEPKTAGAPQPVAPPSDYKPPYPDRVDLFVPPKRQGGVRAGGDEQRAVVLRGFINVDRPQVILSVNGEATPVPEGASYFGVEVVSITPPSVVLQRGRQRWQETLEN